MIKQKNNIIIKILPAVLKNYLDYKTTNNKTASFPISKSNTRALEKNTKRLESVDFGPEITLLGWRGLSTPTRDALQLQSWNIDVTQLAQECKT